MILRKNINSHIPLVVLALFLPLTPFLGNMPVHAVSNDSFQTQTNYELSERTLSLIEGNKIYLTRNDISKMISDGDLAHDDRVIAVFDSKTSSELTQISKSLNSEIPQHQIDRELTVGQGRLVELSVPEGQSLEEFLIELNERTDVLIAELSYKRTLSWDVNGNPDDDYFTNQWQLQNIDPGVRYSIEMPPAWLYVDQELDPGPGDTGDYHGGSSSVIVAVLDTGLAYESRTGVNADTMTGWEYEQADPEMVETASNLWINPDTDPAEEIIDGTDNNGNGFIDDRHGLHVADLHTNPSRTTEDGRPNDDYGHGTHVAHVIGSKTNNEVDGDSYGAGIAHSVLIMPIKVFNQYGWTATSWIIEGLDYAIENDADIINMSFGGETPSTVESAKITEAVTEGIIPVAASGNEGNSTTQYPAGYSDVIAVGATDQDGSRSSYSSYGSWIDLAAPVGSTGFPQLSYECYFDGTRQDPLGCLDDSYDPIPGAFTTFEFNNSAGTSFAAPQVSAASALVLSLYPDFKLEQMRFVLNLSATDVGSSGKDNYTGYGVLNVDNAVKLKNENDYNLTVWSTWEHNGYSLDEINMQVFNPGAGDRLYQAIRGTQDRIFTRYTTDGSNWSEWLHNGYTWDNVNMNVFNGKLYQTVRGTQNRIFTRESSDGNTWSEWVHNGYSKGEIKMQVFNPGSGDRLYQTVRGTQDRIFTRYTTDGSTWSEWVHNGYSTDEINMQVFNPGSGDRLYQTVRGTQDRIFTRYTTDGSTWSEWVHNGYSTDEINMQVFNPGSGDRLYQAVRGTQDRIFTRYTTDGSTWSSWVEGGYSWDNIQMSVFDSKLFLSVRGTQDRVFTKYTTDGSNWSPWWFQSGLSISEVNPVTFNPGSGNVLYQAVRGTQDRIFTRDILYY